MDMLKKILKIGLVFFLIGCATLAVYLYGPWWWTKYPDFDHTYGSIGQIELPEGYKRVPDDGNGYADYLRSLPLAAPDRVVRTTTREVVDSLLPYTYRVVNVPLLHHFEQCADVCIRLRTEYLYKTRQFWKIHYDDTQYHTIRYYGGGYRRLLLRYLHQVFLYANTESLVHEMPRRSLGEIQCGDVFVYSVKDRDDKKYGHAILVADVAVHPVTGKKIFMLLQGSTPACSMHILKNNANPAISPWFEMDEKASTFDFGTAVYRNDELRYFNQ